MKTHKNLRITDGRGFHIVCANGATVSVQWGHGNYCENRSSLKTYEEEMAEKRSSGGMSSNDAEVAVWFATGKWHNWGDDEVIGHIPADEVARLIGYVQSWQPGTPFSFVFNPEVLS